MIYFSSIEKKDLQIRRFVISFQKKYKYPYLRNDFEQSEEVLKTLNNMLNILESERSKDRETILCLRNNFHQDTLIEIKSYFCCAKDKHERSIPILSEIFASIVISGLVLCTISFNSDLQVKLEKETYNALFGSSLLVFLGLPFIKWLLHRTTNQFTEMYSKCINLLDRAINSYDDKSN